MADKNEYLLRKYHATGTVAYSAIESTLRAVQNPQNEWGNTVSQFYNATKQLDSLWNDMEPVFSLMLPVPKKPFGTQDAGKTKKSR
jgi:hypothetical protein